MTAYSSVTLSGRKKRQCSRSSSHSATEAVRRRVLGQVRTVSDRVPTVPEPTPCSLAMVSRTLLIRAALLPGDHSIPCILLAAVLIRRVMNAGPCLRCPLPVLPFASAQQYSLLQQKCPKIRFR